LQRVANKAGTIDGFWEEREIDPGKDESRSHSAPVKDSDSAITPGVVAGEVRDFVRAHESRRRLFPRAALAGLLAGLIAVAFRRTLELFEWLRNALISFGHLHPNWGFFIPMIFGAVGAHVVEADFAGQVQRRRACYWRRLGTGS
jgi:hypothetical protein